MRLIDPIIAEFDRECATTGRLLERVPDGKLDWKPHPKSMSLGELAWHLATIPEGISGMVLEGRFDLAARVPRAAPRNAAQILDAFTRSVRAARQNLDRLDDDAARSTFTLVRGAKEILTAPRIGVVRTILLNHSVHHRGQLSVYLRLLEIPVPAIYGRSADEDPFAS